MQRFAVIMAGGTGERFWPLSRKSRPKHLWNITGEKSCLLSQTFKRVSLLVPQKNIFIITNKEQIEGIKEFAPEIPLKNIITEPCGRDTAAAIVLAATIIKSKNENASFAVFPADHIICDKPAFSEIMLSAFEVAEGGDRLVTVGLVPTFPATGYGYIKRGKKFETSLGKYYKASKFFEKPNLARATKYLKSGDFYWNAGIFVWKLSSILAAIEKNIPDTFKVFDKIYANLKKNSNPARAIGKQYEKLEKISIDFAVMEKAKNVYVVPATFDWDDVGSWRAIERHCCADINNIVEIGEVYSKDSKNCVVLDKSERATALVGVEDLIVIHAKDATLICKKDCSESLKDLVKTLPKNLK